MRDKKFHFNQLLAALVFGSYSALAWPAGMPEGFESFFELQPTELHLRNLNGGFTQPIVFLTSFDTVKLDKDDSLAIQQVKRYLTDNGIKQRLIPEILDSLMVGVQDKNLCQGKLQDCDLRPQSYQFVQNYNDRELYLFVSPTVLDLSGVASDADYHNSLSAENGLINSIDLYASKYSSQNESFSLNNRTVLGLPYGYLKSGFNANTGDDKFQLDELGYHLDTTAYSANIGYFTRSANINSTNFLNSYGYLSQISASIASSDDLVIGRGNSTQIISFYSPKDAYMKVYRDEAIIYQRPVVAGQNQLSYSELPTGRYEVTLLIQENSGEDISRQNYQIYNATNDNLARGEFDFLISGGVLQEGRFYSDDVSVDLENSAFAQGALAYRLFGPLVLGVSGLTTEEGQMFSGGAMFHWLELGLDSEVVYSRFDEAQHLKGYIGFSGLNASYEQLDNEERDPLASFLYGYSEYSRFALNASYYLGSGRLFYGNYSWNENTALAMLSESQSYESASLGFGSPFIVGSSVNLNLDYSFETDATRFSLIWSVPLSNDISTSVGFSGVDSSLQQMNLSVRKDKLIESDAVNSSLELRDTYNRTPGDRYQEALLSLSGTTEAFRANLGAYASTNDRQGVTAGLSSTQVVTANGVYFTSQAASSYIVVDVDRSQNEEDSDVAFSSSQESGYFSLSRDGRGGGRSVIYDSGALIPLRDYAQYQASFDAESVDLYNSGESRKQLFSHPGTVVTLAPKVSRVISFITAFNDLQELPVLDVLCEGDGCLSVTEVVEGVYRVSVLEGLNFQLLAKQSTCLLPYEFASTVQMNFGRNYCLPMDEEGHLVNIDGKEMKAVFLGVYDHTDEVKKAVTELKKVGYSIIQKEIGKMQAIYISQTPSKFDDMLVKYRKAVTEVKSLARQNYSADSVSFPVAQQRN